MKINQEQMMDKIHDDERVERIRKRAHQLWEADGHPDGRHVDYWLAAERELATLDSGEPPAEDAPQNRSRRTIAPTPENNGATEKLAESGRINRKPVKSGMVAGRPVESEEAPAVPATPRTRRKAHQNPDQGGRQDDV